MEYFKTLCKQQYQLKIDSIYTCDKQTLQRITLEIIEYFIQQEKQMKIIQRNNHDIENIIEENNKFKQRDQEFHLLLKENIKYNKKVQKLLEKVLSFLFC